MPDAVHHPQANRLRHDAEALAAAAELAERFAAGAAERDRERRLPHAEVAAFYAAGLGAIRVPKAYGGAAVSAITLGEVVARLAAADGSLAQIPQNHTAFLELLSYSLNEAQKQFFFTQALAGASFGNGLAERYGKTTKEISTRLSRDEKGYRLDGQKFYATGALFSRFVPIGAVDEAGRVFRVVMPAGTKGLSIVDDWSGIGQRTTASGTVTLQEARVPDDHVIAVHEFAGQPNLYGAVSQYYQAAIDLGLARGALKETIRFVRESARPWIDSGKETAAEDPLTIAEVGALQYRLHAAEALMERAGEQLDRAAAQLDAKAQAASSIAVAEAKVLTTEIALEAASKLFELGGARAALAKHGFDRYWRDARVHTLHDPVRWKLHAIGNHALNDAALPAHAWI
jgi:SfnB family sulfur acquisition oxidoreductase